MAIDTSAEYKAAIKSDTELTAFEAEFGFIPDGAVSGSSVSSSNQHSLSRISQIRDGVKNLLSYATAEKNGWPLDKSRVMLNTSDSTQQIGSISHSLSGLDGVFSTPPPLTYTLDTSYDIIGITLFFSEIEWATSVTVQYYNASNVLINSCTFTNDKRVMAIELTQTGVKKIVVTINSWSMPYHHAKICEMLPGEVFVFDSDNTIAFEFTESIKPFNTAIEFPQFIIKFDNSSKKFDVVNPSGLMAYLRKLMKVLSKIGVLSGSFEYVSTGDFYVYSWPDTSQEDTAQLICKPRMAFLTNTVYTATGTGTQTVAQAAARIFTLAGITNYTVDSTLQGITVNQYIGDNVPLTNAMGQLAVAAGGYWRFNRDGSYSLVPYAVAAKSNSIDYDNMWSKPSIEQIKKITSVNVKYYTVGTDGKLIENNNIVTAATNDGTAVSDICSCFVPSAARASAIGALALSFYTMRLSHSVSYRGDMSIQAGDTVSVENDYGDCDVFVTSHNITWDAENKLSGSFKGVANA